MAERKQGNGQSRFWIEVKSEDELEDADWLGLLLEINAVIDWHELRHGKFDNVGAFLCEHDD